MMRLTFAAKGPGPMVCPIILMSVCTKATNCCASSLSASPQCQISVCSFQTSAIADLIDDFSSGDMSGVTISAVNSWNVTPIYVTHKLKTVRHTCISLTYLRKLIVHATPHSSTLGTACNMEDPCHSTIRLPSPQSLAYVQRSASNACISCFTCIITREVQWGTDSHQVHWDTDSHLLCMQVLLNQMSESSEFGILTSARISSRCSIPTSMPTGGESIIVERGGQKRSKKTWYVWSSSGGWSLIRLQLEQGWTFAAQNKASTSSCTIYLLPQKKKIFNLTDGETPVKTKYFCQFLSTSTRCSPERTVCI